jgi:hypothetical protein
MQKLLSETNAKTIVKTTWMMPTKSIFIKFGTSELNSQAVKLSRSEFTTTILHLVTILLEKLKSILKHAISQLIGIQYQLSLSSKGNLSTRISTLPKVLVDCGLRSFL